MAGSRYGLRDLGSSVNKNVLLRENREAPRVDDRRALNGIFWVHWSGTPWRDPPERHGPHKVDVALCDCPGAPRPGRRPAKPGRLVTQ